MTGSRGGAEEPKVFSFDHIFDQVRDRVRDRVRVRLDIFDQARLAILLTTHDLLLAP